MYRRLLVEAGKQRLFIGMNESGQSGDFDFTLEREVNLEPGRHLVVEFNDVEQSFVFRQE